MTYLKDLTIGMQVKHEIHGLGTVLDDKDDEGRVNVAFDSGITIRVTLTMLMGAVDLVEDSPVDFLKPEVYNDDPVDEEIAYKALHELCNWKF